MIPKITYEVTCEPEDIPFVGNCMASGDPAVDREAEEWIRAELEAGNDWAWCCAKVTATVEVSGAAFRGTSYLGGCSYKSQAEFEADGYYEGMKHEAFLELRASLADEADRGITARAVLDALPKE